MVKTAIVHGDGDLTLARLCEIIAKTTEAIATIEPFQLPRLGATGAWESAHGDVVSAVRVASDPPICFRLPEAGEFHKFREACRSLERYSPDEWATLVAARGCVFVESGRHASVHSRSADMTVSSIPVLQLTKPQVKQTIWHVAEALDALVLGEEGQLIWRPGECNWSEPSLQGGRQPIATRDD